MSDFTDVIAFYFDTISDFLMSEPIVYITIAVIGVAAVGFIRKLLNFRL